MKVKPEHIEVMLNALKDMEEDIKLHFKNNSKLSEKRLQWNCLWACQIQGNTAKWITDVLYPYMDDSHIDTALKHCFKQLGIKKE